GECDLIVKGNQHGRTRGWLLGADGLFAPDFAGEPGLTDDELRAQAAAASHAPTPACPRAQASASASIATTTARPTAPSSTKARIRRMHRAGRRACPTSGS